MKKRVFVILIFVAIVVIASMLFGCGAPDNTVSQGVPENAVKQEASPRYFAARGTFEVDPRMSINDEQGAVTFVQFDFDSDSGRDPGGDRKIIIAVPSGTILRDLRDGMHASIEYRQKFRKNDDGTMVAESFAEFPLYELVSVHELR